MDPNQPNQDDNHTGDGRQAIFSSPTTEPAPAPQPAETVAPVQPAEPIAAPTEPAPTVGATPAAKPVIDPSMPEPASDPTPVAAPTTNPEPVATPGIIASTPTIATPAETGDIILSPDGPRPHNKRPFIIGGLILAVVAIIAIALVALFKGFQPTTNSNASVAKTQFDQFATYLLYGKSEDVLSGEYDGYKSYELDLQLEKDEIDLAYWEKSAELLNKAITSATEDQSITRYLIQSLQSYQQTFNFIRTYRQNGDLGEERLLSTYLSSGSEAAETLIDNFYARYNTDESSLTANYVVERKTQYNDLLKIYAFYNDLSCIKNGVIDEPNCNIPSGVTANSLDDLFELTMTAQANANTMIGDSVVGLKSRCWNLSAWLNDPTDERDEGNDEK